MNERETKEIVTPIGKNKVVIRTWLTGREQRTITSVLLKKVDFGPAKEETDQKGEAKDMETSYKVSGDALNEHMDAKINAVVVNVDGKSDGILDAILDMNSKDTDFVIKEINEVVGGLKEEDKKK